MRTSHRHLKGPLEVVLAVDLVEASGKPGLRSAEEITVQGAILDRFQGIVRPDAVRAREVGQGPGDL